MHNSSKNFSAMNEVGIIFLILLVIVLATINSRASNPGTQDNSQAVDIMGCYLIPNGMIIEIYEEGQSFSGRIINIDNYNENESRDLKNPDKDQRDQVLMGKRIIIGLRYISESGEWSGGQMYAPDKGMTVDLKILSVHPDHLMAEGSKFLFSKKLRWEKVSHPEKE